MYETKTIVKPFKVVRSWYRQVEAEQKCCLYLSCGNLSMRIQQAKQACITKHRLFNAHPVIYTQGLSNDQCFELRFKRIKEIDTGLRPDDRNQTHVSL